MKQPPVSVVIIASLFFPCLRAQNGGMVRGGAHFPSSGLLPPLASPLRPWGGINPGLAGHHIGGWWPGNRASGRYNVPFWGYPFYSDDPGYFGDGQMMQAAPSIIVLVPQVEAPNPQPPPPIRAAIHEYNWPAPRGDSTAARFSIVAKDRSVEYAVAVWVKGEVLHYVTADGSDHSIRIESVDREATRKRNAENGLNLWLPDGS